MRPATKGRQKRIIMAVERPNQSPIPPIGITARLPRPTENPMEMAEAKDLLLGMVSWAATTVTEKLDKRPDRLRQLLTQGEGNS